MPVSPRSPITQAEQDGLNALLTDYRAKNATWLTAQVTFNTSVTSVFGLATAAQCPDIFGDGRIKSLADCTSPPGWIPPRMRPPLGIWAASRSGYVPGSETTRRHPGAVVSVADMQAAEVARVAHLSAMRTRGTAGQLLNSRISKLGFKVPQPFSYILDVFGDGLSRQIDFIVWPTGIAPFRGRVRKV